MESALMDIFMRYAPDMNCAEGKKSGSLSKNLQEGLDSQAP
jgi:hypothetical protein